MLTGLVEVTLLWGSFEVLWRLFSENLEHWDTQTHTLGFLRCAFASGRFFKAAAAEIFVMHHLINRRLLKSCTLKYERRL